MTGDENGADSDPFQCPVCGERAVQVRGDGTKTCTECPWEFRPSRDKQSETTKQVGLTDF